jgi:hypothetical protein
MPAMCIILNMAASIVSLRFVLQILFLIKITSQLQYKWQVLNMHDKENFTHDNTSFCNKKEISF